MGEMADFRAGVGNIPSEPGVSCVPESKDMFKQNKTKNKTKNSHGGVSKEQVSTERFPVFKRAVKQSSIGL